MPRPLEVILIESQLLGERQEVKVSWSNLVEYFWAPGPMFQQRWAAYLHHDQRFQQDLPHPISLLAPQLHPSSMTCQDITDVRI